MGRNASDQGLFNFFLLNIHEMLKFIVLLLLAKASELITDVATIAPSKIEVVMILEAVMKILLLTER